MTLIIKSHVIIKLTRTLESYIQMTLMKSHVHDSRFQKIYWILVSGRGNLLFLMRVTHVNDSGILALSRQSLQKITLWKKK